MFEDLSLYIPRNMLSKEADSAPFSEMLCLIYLGSRLYYHA